MKEPPVSYWVMGANEWRRGADWPLPETQWTKLYLASWERLTAEPLRNAARFGDHHFCISSIHSCSSYYRILTIHNVPTSARFAHSVVASDQAYTDPLTDFPSGHSAA